MIIVSCEYFCTWCKLFEYLHLGNLNLNDAKMPNWGYGKNLESKIVSFQIAFGCLVHVISYTIIFLYPICASEHSVTSGVIFIKNQYLLTIPNLRTFLSSKFMEISWFK